jgi:hypothetical protein
MSPLIVFELNDMSKLDLVKSELLKIGYYNSWLTDKQISYTLPFNCMWKVSAELSTAIKEIQGVIELLNQKETTNAIILKRCMVFSNTPFAGIQDAPPSPPAL